MILAEKLAQKLSNLKSKSKIKDYFIYFDESRSLEFVTLQGGISKRSHPTHYSELSKGNYLIVWNEGAYSMGEITTSSVNLFEEFIDEIEKSALPLTSKPFIAAKGIYPMIRAYSKALADMIDVPEYLLKLTDILDEMFQMIKCYDGKAELVARDGYRYAFSSEAMDENYPYTEFELDIYFSKHLTWRLELAELFSISQFQEFFSFLGDSYNHLNSKNTFKLKSNSVLILNPMDFKKLFEEQILRNINGENVINGTSIFSKEHFFSRAKVLGSLSLSYDPLINSKRGTYRFSNSGVKAEKEYFIKFGKLDQAITDYLNYSIFDVKKPSVSINHFGNLKFEGIKKSTFYSFIKQNNPVFITKSKSIISKSHTTYKLITDSLLEYKEGKVSKSEELVSIEINLFELIGAGKAELVEFPDGQFGLGILD